jgi:hypothetical protein
MVLRGRQVEDLAGGVMGRSVGFFVVALAATACSSGSSFEKSGRATPTVSGSTAPAYADLEAARASFSRTDGPLSAILLDTAWIRLEPDPLQAEQRYPEYFEGFTSFEVTLQTQKFSRPTDETYLLEDSTGVSVTAKPKTYKGDFQKGFGPKFGATFKLVFPHAMSKDVRWLRLTRKAPEDGKVTWEFPAS